MIKKIKVLIVDDSALIRTLLTKILNSSAEIEVIGTAPDPLIARDKIKKLNPDVLTLDIEMPKMDGLTFLEKLMRLHPMPVVMISSLTEKGAASTLKAMELGAVDFVAKPKTDLSNTFTAYASEIIAKIKMAANAHVQAYELSKIKQQQAQPKFPTVKKPVKIIAIGSSTGGTEAIKEIVRALPATTPPIVVSQHLPAAFSHSFAKHVDEVTAMHAFIALDFQPIEPGNIYIAPGDKHLEIIRQGAEYICRLKDGPEINHHKPSVEVMFESIANNVGPMAIGIMLTGMGADGARAMKLMRDNGACNIVQDEDSSVVWGMAGEAYKLGAAEYVLSLSNIASQILALT